MTKEQLEKVKQMMVSENTDDANLVGVVLRQLFKDEECFKQFTELMLTASLYPMKDLLQSNIIEPRVGYNTRQFQVRLISGDE